MMIHKARQHSSSLRVFVSILISLMITVTFVSFAFLQPPPPNLAHTARAAGSVLTVKGPQANDTFGGNITSASLNCSSNVLAFTVNSKEGGNLWFLNLLTQNFVARMSFSQNVSDVEWSADGKWVSFLSTSRTGTTLHVADSQSQKQLVTISSFSNITDVSWSPTSDLIVFSGLKNGQWNLYLEVVDNKSTLQLTTDGRDWYGSWASNGSIIYSKSDKSGSNVWSLNLRTKVAEQLTNSSGEKIWPEQGPDGSVAFVSNSSGVWSIYQLKNGSIQDILGIAAMYAGTQSPLVDPSWEPIWSASADRIFFIGYDSFGRINSFAINFTGSILAPSDFSLPPEQQMYSTTYYIAPVVTKIDANSTLPFVMTSWCETTQSALSMIESSPNGLALVQVGTSGPQTNVNVYGANT